MRIESVAYRYSRDEVLALIALAGADSILGLSLGVFDGKDVTQGLESLEDAGIAMHVGDHWYLERTMRYLFKTASSVKRLLKVSAGIQELLLYQLDDLALMVKRGPSDWYEFMPVREIADALKGWRDTMRTMTDKTVTLVLADNDKNLSLCHLSREEAISINADTLRFALTDWEFSRKKGDPWKPS